MRVLETAEFAQVADGLDWEKGRQSDNVIDLGWDFMPGNPNGGAYNDVGVLA